MSELGNLFYSVRLRDLTDQDLQAITQKLRNIGVQADTASLRKSIEDYLSANPVNVRFNPQITSKEIEDRLTGQVIHAEIHPLTSNLVSAVNTALRGNAINIDTLSIDPSVMQNAVRGALTGAGFSAVGDGIADAVEKSVQAKLSGKTFTATVEVSVEKLSNSIIAGIEKAEKRGIKIDTKNIRKDVEDALKSKVKVGLDPQISVADCEKSLQGKVIKAEIVPLATKLRSAIQEAFKDKPVEVSVGPKAGALQRLVTDVLTRQGYMLNISTVTGLESAIKRALVGNNHLTLTVDPTAVVSSLRTALTNVQSSSFGLTVQRDILRDSINTALAVKPFNIQIAVAHDQARRAVQNAINNARLMGKDDALAYQHLKTGELKAAQAELARLKAAHMGAADAAKAHASASLNLGGALGSNIKIAGELGATMTSLYSIHALKNFLSQVVEIGGELEHQKIALETIYGSGSKMESLYGKIKSLARESPFGVMELTGNIKQLSAYGVAYNEVYDTAKRLADISAATSVDIQRLILAYGKTKNRTFLDGLEAKQFAYANIPIYDALSKKLTELEGKFVSVKDVMGRIKKREIGFDMVKDILWEMTDAGGKFCNMQEKLAGSVKTSWKLVKDNIQLMFGEIAESSWGGSLKTLAEILQGLTKEWRVMGSAIAAGAIAFGTYKLAVLASNTVLGRHNLAVAQSALMQKKEIIAKATGVNIYRALTLEEQRAITVKKALSVVNSKNILSSKTLSRLQLLVLNREKLLTKELALRLIATKKITAADAEMLVKQGLITEKEKQMALGAAKATKQFNILGKSVTFNAARFKILGSAIWSALKSIGMLGLQTLPLAAISAAIALWSKNNEEMEKAKELGEEVFRKASDGAKDLKDILESTSPSATLSDLELNQEIEKLEEAIKDYSPTPIKDINDALVTQDGHLNTLVERWGTLKKRVEELKAAYDDMKKNSFSTMVEGALKATDGGNWFTQLFDDNLQTNAKDYTNALKSREDEIAKFASKHREAMQTAVDAALEADEKFAEATKGLTTYEAKLSYLIENAENFTTAVYKFNATTAKFDEGKTLDDLSKSGKIQSAYEELVSDTDKFVEDMNSRMSKLQWNPKLLTDTQKTELEISLKAILDSMSEAGEDAKIIIAKKWEEAWNIVLMEDKIGPMIQAKFKNIVANSTDETLKEAAKVAAYEGAAKLSDAQREAWIKAGAAAKDQAMSDLKLTHLEMGEYLAKNPLMTTIQLIYTDPQTAPNGLAKQLVANHGYSGLTPKVDHYVRQWSKAGTMYGARNAAKESLQAAYSELEAAKKEGGELEKKAQAAYDEIWKALEYLGWTDIEVKDQKSNKHTSTKSKKDLIAEAFKQRFKDLKDAWAEYQKWQKSIGDMAAADKVADSGLFGDMKAEDIPRTAEQYREAVKKLRSELEAAGIKGHSERESLLNEYIKHILDIDKTIVDENIKKALEVVERAFEKETADFNLYEKIRQATGNEKLAYTFSFGLNGGQTDYIQLVKDHFKKLSDAAKQADPAVVTYSFDIINEENVTDLPDELQKAWREAVKSISKYEEEQRSAVADMLSEYQTSQEEIVKLKAEAAEKIKKIEKEVANGSLSRASADLLIGKINTNLDYEIFKRSGEYLKFFNATLSLTASEAENIGRKIRENLDRKLQKGQITAKEYADEIEKIKEKIDEIRNKSSKMGDFFKGGLQNVFEQAYKKAEAQLNAASTDYDNAAQRYQIAVQNGDEAGAQSAQNAMDAASSMMKGAEAAMQGAQGAMQTVAVIDTIVHGINDTVQGIKGSFDLIADMADSFGVDTSADTGWGAAGAALEAFSQASQHATDAWDSLKSGNVGGVIKGVVGSFTSWFTVFNRWHDAKLQKDIERSQLQFQKWQYIIDSVERRMEHFLGNVRNVRVVDANRDSAELARVQQKINAIRSQKKIKLWDLDVLDKLGKEAAKLRARVNAYNEGGALGYERQLMTEQLSELERQKADMERMKKKDPQAIADLEDQIDEQRQAIRDFAEEMASTVYGIDLNDWASQIGDALVDAFARGEDAAEAFDKTASSIMRSLVSKMISQDIIAPMFNDLRDYLFGADGMSGAYGKDFFLDASEVSAMSDYLSMIRDEGIPRAQELFDAINAATGGLLDDTESADNSVRAGIQSLTENTGDLLASYVNGIRGDVSLMANIHWPRLIDYIASQSVVAEAQTQQLRLIAENTRRNMLAAEAIQSSVASIQEAVIRASRSKDYAFYVR